MSSHPKVSSLSPTSESSKFTHFIIIMGIVANQDVNAWSDYLVLFFPQQETWNELD